MPGRPPARARLRGHPGPELGSSTFRMFRESCGPTTPTDLATAVPSWRSIGTSSQPPGNSGRPRRELSRVRTRPPGPVRRQARRSRRSSGDSAPIPSVQTRTFAARSSSPKRFRGNAGRPPRVSRPAPRADPGFDRRSDLPVATRPRGDSSTPPTPLLAAGTRNLRAESKMQGIS